MLAATLASPALAVRLRTEVLTTSGLVRPIAGVGLPGDPNSLLIVEQFDQDIRLLDTQTNQFTDFLNLPNVGFGGEGGLKGIALHPDFETNGKLYVHQFERDIGQINILEFTRSAANPSVADPASQRTVLSFMHDPSRVDHTGGWLGFSPVDGYLYIPTGDGGSSPPDRGIDAQDPTKLRGKVLRLDVDGDDFPADDGKNYAIPSTNPFAAGGGAPEVYALGLRSPFRASFDDANGDLYIGDVGSVRFDEINLLPNGGAGTNFGWVILEGEGNSPFSNEPAPPGAVDPLYSYAHAGSASVTGGVVYRGSAIPELVGDYIFADFARRDFFTITPGDAPLAEADAIDRTAELRNPNNDQPFSVPGFFTDSDGEIYFLDYFAADVMKIVPGVDGDYDVDGDVDADDYLLWRDTFGQTNNLAADGNRDGVVNAADFTVWRDNLGAAAGAPGSTPEPSTLLLIAGALLAGGRRCR